MGGSIVQRLGALDAMRTMMSVLREVSLEEIRHQAETPPRLLVVAPTVDAARQLGLEITGPEGQFSTLFRAIDEPVATTGPVDAAVVWDPDRTGAASRVEEAMRFESPPMPIVRFEGSWPGDGEALDRLRLDIVKRNSERAAAFGRALPAFRAAASKQLIDETAAANAQFSLVSNVPALLPVIGGLAAAGADFIVLTKNQVMMLYKLAAVHGRDLRDQRAILQEVIPVVGAALAWRTIAREAAALMPFAAGTIPKLVIAYVGTIVVGKAAEFYYRTGMKPSRQQMDQFTRQAIERLRQLDVPGLRRILRKNEMGQRAQLRVIREDDQVKQIGGGQGR
jgi:hypothetical protein